MTDNEYIDLTLKLAAQGIGLASPNPLVGSVVVKNGEIVGRGYHRYDDLKHAEVWALEEAGSSARDSTVYVNLEPCSHQGEGKRTPPCVRAIIESGARRVVASMVDPNPRVDGRGFDQLRDAGIEVTKGVLEPQARRLNEIYTKFVTTGIPFVHLKSATSLDGRIATRTGDSKWITGIEARAVSQALRHEYDAILVGIGTVLEDDPLLTDRTGLPRRMPLSRVVLDTRLRIPVGSNLVRTTGESPLLIFTALDHPSDSHSARTKALKAAGVEVIGVTLSNDRLDLSEVLRVLGDRRITGLIVEGGAEVAGAFIEQKIIDKASFFIAPRIIGGKDSVPAIAGTGFERLDDSMLLENIEVKRHGNDWEFTGYPRYAS